MDEHFIIAGGGQSAAQAAATLRQKNFAGRITIVGEEPHLPYQRPPLSKKFLAGELEAERLMIRPENFYADAEVDVKLGVRVEELNVDKKRVLLNDDSELDFDGLLLATGSSVRELDVPGNSLDGIHYLRTRDDSQAIAVHLAPGRRLVIVGAGYIGLEVAAIAVSLGAEVVVLEAADRVMSRVVCPEVSAFYDRKHREAGVDIHYGASVAAFHGNRTVDAVEIDTGESYPCDVIVAGIGIAPRTELATACGLAIDDGIVVDDFARTEIDNIFAAGDCTSHPSAYAGRNIRLESVHNAIEQAKTAASVFLGEKLAYAQVPWFWSDQYDIKLQIAGLSGDHDNVVLRGDPDNGHFAACYLRNGLLSAVDAINSPRDFIGGKKLIEARSRVDTNRLADASIHLADLV
jgi:3-phenylpropionate/trans-cinnamate dioxygenase ferredoxin reductase subunit